MEIEIKLLHDTMFAYLKVVSLFHNLPGIWINKKAIEAYEKAKNKDKVMGSFSFLMFYCSSKKLDVLYQQKRSQNTAFTKDELETIEKCSNLIWYCIDCRTDSSIDIGDNAIDDVLGSDLLACKSLLKISENS